MIIITNVSIYTISNIQYERESKRQLSAYQSMMEHLITMEGQDVAIIYTEHFYHTQKITIKLFDESNNLLYETPIKPEQDTLYYLYDVNEFVIGSFYFDDNRSYLGNELTTGLIIINMISLVLFLIFLRSLLWYLNSWYLLLENDLGNIGKKIKPITLAIWK